MILISATWILATIFPCYRTERHTDILTHLRRIVSLPKGQNVKENLWFLNGPFSSLPFGVFKTGFPSVVQTDLELIINSDPCA